MKEELSKAKITKLNRLVDTLCGIYSRVARRLGVDRTFVTADRNARDPTKTPRIHFDTIQI
jgi:hypothetical protein